MFCASINKHCSIKIIKRNCNLNCSFFVMILETEICFKNLKFPKKTKRFEYLCQLSVIIFNSAYKTAAESRKILDFHFN